MSSTKLQQVLEKLDALTQPTPPREEEERSSSSSVVDEVSSELSRACSILVAPSDRIYELAFSGDAAQISTARSQGLVPIVPMLDYFEEEQAAYPDVAWSVVQRMFTTTFVWLSQVMSKGKMVQSQRTWRSRDRKSVTTLNDAGRKLKEAFERTGVNQLPAATIAKLAMFAPSVDDLARLPRHIPVLCDLLVNAEFWVYKLRTDMMCLPQMQLTTTQYQTAYTNFYNNLPGVRMNQRPHENALVARRQQRTQVKTYPPFAEFRVLFAASMRNDTWWLLDVRDQIKYKWKTLYWMIYLDSILACLVASVYYVHNPSAYPTFSQPCPYRLDWCTFCTELTKLATTGVPLVDDFLTYLPTTLDDVTDAQKLVDGTTMLLQLNQVFIHYIQTVKRRLNLPQGFGFAAPTRAEAGSV